jgi:NADH-quinone oxidoreductase subunit F
VRPPFPAVEGLFRKPTVLNNVETFALIPAALRLGGEAFAKIGTARSTGSKLVSFDSAVNTPGVYEIEMGTPFAAVIEEFGGGFSRPIKAVQVGGPLGGVVPVDKLGDLTLDFESFNEHGFLLGHASIVGIPEEFPMIQYIEHLFEFTADESCGKCFPCRIGSTRGQELMHKARTQDYKIDRELLDDLIEAMEDGSLCALGGGVPLPIRNILEHFADELAPYFDGVSDYA